MKTFLEKLKDRVQCIKIQVFLSYVLVLSLAFVLLGFSVALTARQMMTKQIGASRLDLLRQISERTNTIKTSATTLVGLYRYELTELPGFPERCSSAAPSPRRTAPAISSRCVRRRDRGRRTASSWC